MSPCGWDDAQIHYSGWAIHDSAHQNPGCQTCTPGCSLQIMHVETVTFDDYCFFLIAALCSGHLQYAIICYSKSPCGSLTSECFGLKPSDFHPPHLQFSYVGNDYVTACLSASWYTHPDHRSLQPLKSAWHARNNKFSVIPCYTWLIDSPTWRTVHTKLTYT